MTSEDTTVNIKGTFSVKQREHNGLNRVAEHINADRIVRVPIVGYVVFHKHTETTQGDTLTVSLEAVEPAMDADGKDSKGYGLVVFNMLDTLRKSAGKALVADTLFSPERAAELDGQLDLITRGGEVDRQEAIAADPPQVTNEPPASAGKADPDDSKPARRPRKKAAPKTEQVEPVKSGGMPTEASEQAAVEVFGKVDAVGAGPREAEVNASGEPVPEASAEEILAERSEERARIAADGGKRTAAALARPGVAAALGVQVETGTGITLDGDKPTTATVTGLTVTPPARTARGATIRPDANPFMPS